MEYETVIYGKEDGTAVITFNRPEKRNALNGKMSNEIESALLDAEGDSTIKAIIVTGGPKFFISGADIESLAGEGENLTPKRMFEMHYKTQGLYRTVYGMPKPTIAAISGYAFGGGWNWLCVATSVLLRRTQSWEPLK
jgi:enoyl-CoA hydratase/carnithine racemase